MAEVLIGPDVEQVLDAWLTAQLTDRGWNIPPVAGRVPGDPRPDEFVRLLRVGGQRRARVLDAATVVVEGWAKLDSRAVVLTALCEALILSAPSDPDSSVHAAVSLASPGNLPDPEAGSPRYTATLSVTFALAPEEP